MMSYLSQIFLIWLLCANGLLTFLIWDPRESPIRRNGKSGSFQKAVFCWNAIPWHPRAQPPRSAAFPKLRPSETAKRKKSWWSDMPSSAFVMCTERLAGSVKVENVDISLWPKYLDATCNQVRKNRKVHISFPNFISQKSKFLRY